LSNGKKWGLRLITPILNQVRCHCLSPKLEWELICRIRMRKRRLRYPITGVGEGSGGESEYEIDDSASTVEQSRVGVRT